MENYNFNIRSGEHRVRITLQQGPYIGHIWEDVLGNCRGRDVLEFDFEKEDCEDLENDCSIRYHTEGEYFSAILADQSGNICEIEGSREDFNDRIVALEIISYLEYKIGAGNNGQDVGEKNDY